MKPATQDKFRPATSMQLFRYQHGRFTKIDLRKNSNQRVSNAEVEECLRLNTNMDGSISKLSLDFCGSYISMTSEAEIRLAASLLCAYHNSTIEFDTKNTENVVPLVTQARLTQTPTESESNGEVEAEEMTEEETDDEEQHWRKLDFEYEINADIDATPSFGKVGIVEW